jgi:hypothetical protein
MSYQVQSIIFERPYYTKEDAIRTMKHLKGNIRKIDTTEHYHRFRQLDPINLRMRGYNAVRTKEISPHIKFIIYYKE